MHSWLIGTTREPARALLRGMAGLVLATAASGVFWFDHIGSAFVTIFWALVLMGPVLAWPLTWGPLLGRGSAGIGVLLVILPAYLGSGRGAPPGETALLIAWSVPFFLLAAVLSFPQALIGLVQALIRR